MKHAGVRSFAVLALAIAFWAYFQASKQVPTLAVSNPFAEDPYDAVGSFAIQAAGVLALLSLARTFGVLGGGGTLLARTQLASVLAVGITVAADTIALVRHGGGAALMVLVFVVACVAAAVAVACTRGVRRGRPGPAVAASVIAAVVLLLYPEGTRDSLTGALVAIATGIVVLFVPLRFVTTALVADDQPPALQRRFPFEWVVVLVVALAVGLALATAEGGSEGGLREGVIFIFIGFEVGAAAFGYAMLRGPLRLTLRPNDP